MDLTTPDFVQSIVSDLGAGEILALPRMITTASRLIQNWCNRTIGAQTEIDEIFRVRRGTSIILKEYPVLEIHRVASERSEALRIENRDATVTQARCTFAPKSPTSYAGTSIKLTTKRLGRKSETTINFSDLVEPTIGRLAEAIRSKPGWEATAEGGFGTWGTDDLIAEMGIKDARSATWLEVFAEDRDHRVSRSDGTLQVEGAGGSLERFGWGWGEDSAEIEGEEIRVTYSAGFVAIPEEVQLATAELIKATFERMSTSSVLQSERTDSWAWTAREFGEIVGGMPQSVRQVIANYKNTRQ